MRPEVLRMPLISIFRFHRALSISHRKHTRGHVLGTGGREGGENTRNRKRIRAIGTSCRTSPIFLSFPRLLRGNLRPVPILQIEFFFLFFLQKRKYALHSQIILHFIYFSCFVKLYWKRRNRRGMSGGRKSEKSKLPECLHYGEFLLFVLFLFSAFFWRKEEERERQERLRWENRPSRFA